MALGSLVVYLARRILEPAEQLERSRVILEDAYDRARAESLRDALTGLGNHRAFQEEFERQWLIARRHGTPAGPRDDRPGRLQAGQRPGRPRRGRPLPESLRPHDARPAASHGPGVPGRRRRVRHPAAAVRRGWRLHDHPAAPGRIPGGLDRLRGQAVHLVHRRRQRPARSGGRSRVHVPPGGRRPLLGQAPRADVRHDLRPGQARRRLHTSAGRTRRRHRPGRCAPARCGPSSSRSTTCGPAPSTGSRA